MAVLAVQQIRRMRGGAQGQLMLGADGYIYVVKFQNNPQHVRVLANELLAARLAAAAGLTVPQTELVEVLPRNWITGNTYDVANHWITRAVRDPETHHIVGELSRVGMFELAENGRDFGRWL